MALAVRLLKDGKLVGMPTETVYGLAADALNEDAVRDIFIAKGRPGDNPLIVHIADTAQLYPLIAAAPSPAARALMDAFWPGPMTLIFPKSDRVPLRTTGGLNTVAVRFPSHPVAQSLIRQSGLSLAAPSGNRSGRPSPTTAAHMLEDMNGRIELILDGGSCDVGVESTVIDVTGSVPRILRPGGVTREMIAEVCGACEVDGAVMRPLKENERPKSPGMKYRHYAPAGQLTIFHGDATRVSAAICTAYDQARGELADAGGLAHAVHTDDQQHHRAVQTHGLRAQYIYQNLLQRLARLFGISDLFALAALAQPRHGQLCGVHAHVRHYQDIGQILIKVVVELLIILHQLVHAPRKDLAGSAQAVFDLVKQSHPLLTLLAMLR